MLRIKHLTTVFICSVMLLGFISTAQALTAREIMEKVDARDDGDNMTANVEMILIDKNDNRRIREMKTFTKDKGQDTWKLQFFLSPADVKDTGFLTYDYYEGDRDDDQWLYLPDLHKTKRIATSDKSSAFMGSDFSYADMTQRVLDEWTYKLLKESEVNDQKVWLIEALPASKEVEEKINREIDKEMETRINKEMEKKIKNETEVIAAADLKIDKGININKKGNQNQNQENEDAKKLKSLIFNTNSTNHTNTSNLLYSVAHVFVFLKFPDVRFSHTRTMVVRKSRDLDQIFIYYLLK